jgi:LmbE family N-acetylglucosaminyl deacetylase
MPSKTNNRRAFVKAATLGMGALTLNNLIPARGETPINKKKIVCVGGHPDDPESGCGGTLALLANQGHEVVIIYLTAGQAGITGKTHEEAAVIRRAEAVNGCRILQAKPIFAGQVDGDTIVNNTWISRLKELIGKEQPALVFTHWPIDSHKDHQVASLLTIQAWMAMDRKFGLYFFEVSYGIQTQGFNPTDYIDITATREQKRKAVFCHVSQNPQSIYTEAHSAMEDFRGKEIGVSAAEAFVRMNERSKTGFFAS